LALALALTACGSDPAPPITTTAPTTTAPTTTAPTTTAPTTTAPTTTAPPSSAPGAHALPVVPDATQRAAARDAVREGRAAAAASHFEEAFAAFQRALEIDGSSRRLRCEAGYVAHRAGHDDRAESLIDAALAGMPDIDSMPEELRVPYAQCLYNAGLVYEATHRPDDARDAFDDSLELRPNDTVETHLDALPPRTPRSLVLRASMSDEDIRIALGTRLSCPDQEYVPPTEDDWDGPFAFPIALDEGVTAPDVSVSVYALAVDTCDWSYDDRVLVVRAGERMAAFLLYDVAQGGGTEHDAHTTSTSVRDLVPGGLPEILLSVDTWYGDGGDGSGCVSYEESASRSIVCTLEPSIACAQIATARTIDTTCDASCDDDEQQCGHGHLPRAGHHTTHPVAASLTFANGQAVVNVTSDTAHVLPAGIVGTHDLATLIRLSPLAAL
jgi:hypothetical protein